MTVPLAALMLPENVGRQTYGCPTYDTLFKYFLGDDIVRNSFLNTFIPGETIISSEKLDSNLVNIQRYHALLWDSEQESRLKDDGPAGATNESTLSKSSCNAVFGQCLVFDNLNSMHY